jgi:hypothetical protein
MVRLRVRLKEKVEEKKIDRERERPYVINSSHTKRSGKTVCDKSPQKVTLINR